MLLHCMLIFVTSVTASRGSSGTGTAVEAAGRHGLVSAQLIKLPSGSDHCDRTSHLPVPFHCIASRTRVTSSSLSGYPEGRRRSCNCNLSLRGVQCSDGALIPPILSVNKLRVIFSLNKLRVIVSHPQFLSPPQPDALLSLPQPDADTMLLRQPALQQATSTTIS